MANKEFQASGKYKLGIDALGENLCRVTENEHRLDGYFRE